MKFISSRGVRPTIISAAGLVAVALAPPLSAQPVDLNRIVRGLPADARNAIRQGEQLMAAQECEQLKRWVSAVPASPYPPSVSRDVNYLLPYVEDSMFSRHFGKTYEQLTVGDIRNVQKAQGECRRLGLFTPAEAQLIRTIWNPSMQNRLAQQMVAQRAQRSEVGALMQELDTLEPTEADYRRIDSIKSRGDALARSMSSDEQRSFSQRVSTVRQRIGMSVEQQRVDAAIASASDAQGIVRLAELYDELRRSALGQQVEPLRARLQARIGTLAATVAASERASAPSLQAPTLEALESSKRWSVEFISRYQKVFAVATPLDELRRDVLRQRGAAISQLQARILVEINSASNAMQASATVVRYLLDEEQRDATGRAVKVAADVRSDALQRAARNEAVFGREGESATMPAAAPAVAANVNPAVARCDALAADPNDPTRAASGVADGAISAPAAIAACTEATMAQPGLARAHFQLGRALLVGGQQREALGALQQAAKAEHPGALAYLGTAHQYGAGGLPQSKAMADELHAKAASLGYGTQAAPRAAGNASTPIASGSLKGDYEQPAIVKALYFGDVSLLPKERMFTFKYLLTHAEMLARDCQSFKLSEIRTIQENAMRSVTPRTQDEAVAAGGQHIGNIIMMMAEAMKNPQSMVDAGAREQRLEDAPAYAERDLFEFTKHYGACGSAPLTRYTNNLRKYFQSPEASLQ